RGETIRLIDSFHQLILIYNRFNASCWTAQHLAINFRSIKPVNARFMVMHRHLFFGYFFILLIVPPVAYRLIWLASSTRTQGVFYMEGHGNALEQIRTAYSFVYFKHGTDTVWFEGVGNRSYKEGQQVPVLYHKDHPADARVDDFLSVWGATVIYGGIPVLVL